MSFFPPTSLTLLQKLSAEVTGVSETAWVRFFGLYTPAIRRFVEWNDSIHDPDDVVQEVYLKLVEIVRSGKYDRDKARFRTFLAMLIRHQLISLYRKDQTRGGSANISLESMYEADEEGGAGTFRPQSEPSELSVPDTQVVELDLKWARAKHEASVEHVLTKVAMKAQSREIYRAYVLENRPVEDVSTEFGVSPDIIYKVKNRVGKMIEAVEEEYAEEKS